MRRVWGGALDVYPSLPRYLKSAKMMRELRGLRQMIERQLLEPVRTTSGHATESFLLAHWNSICRAEEERRNDDREVAPREEENRARRRRGTPEVEGLSAQ